MSVFKSIQIALSLCVLAIPQVGPCLDLDIDLLGTTNENEFDADLTVYIDSNSSTGNMIFRGDIPVNSRGKIQYNQVKKAMKAAYEAAQKDDRSLRNKWPKKYNVVFISNLTEDVQVEADFLDTVYDYFGGSGSPIPMKSPISNKKGVWYWWQVNPYYDADPPLSEDVSWRELERRFGSLTRQEVTDMLVNQTWNGRTLDFVGLIETIKSLMDTSESRPVMTYIHSRRGYNRSTAVTCAYRMRYKGEDIETAYNNSLVENSNIFEQQGLKAFLYYYKRYLDLF